MDITSLTKSETKAVDAFLKKLDDLYAGQIYQVILYGSKARGDSKRDSDVDLLVLLNSDAQLGRGNILRLAARTSLDFDVLLSVIVMTQDHWERHEGLSMYANVQQDGLQIAG